MLLDQEGTRLSAAPSFKLRLADRTAEQLGQESWPPATNTPALPSPTSFPLFLIGPGPPEDRAAQARGGERIRGARTACALSAVFARGATDKQGRRRPARRPGSPPPRDAQLRAAGSPNPAGEQPTPRGRSVPKPEVRMTVGVLSPGSSERSAEHTGPAFWRSLLAPTLAPGTSDSGSFGAGASQRAQALHTPPLCRLQRPG